MTECWRFDAPGQTLVLASAGQGVPEAVYWGAPLGAGEDLAALAATSARDVTGGMLDAHPPLSLCPEARRTFPGQTGLRAFGADGIMITPDFRLESVADGVFTCVADGFRLVFSVAILGESFRLQTRLESDAPVVVDWLAAPVLPGQGAEIIEVSGRWCGEFQLSRMGWAPGARLRDNPTGRSGHEHFPALITCDSGATECRGRVWGWSYGWAGGHKMLTEQLPDGRRQVQFGAASSHHRLPGTIFETAPLYASYSDAGLNGLARAQQRLVRDHIRPQSTPRTPRPVHYNCWEAIYFNHDIKTLKDIATRAADLGAERFVLDDGWFGVRDDDTSSLGDWVIDPRKYPDGLTPLIDHIQSLGMGFGLWVEPEMVNPDSDLYRAHPGWALGPADQTLGRQQMVLDMANPAVQEYLFERLSAILSGHDIEYLKWDHNRVAPVVDPAQTTGVYALIDRLRAAHPGVEIESCSSGGGRVDYGILERTDRVWLSDSNDALVRFRMQRDAALFLPGIVTGSHVGPRHCHTSGRVLPIAFRAWVAATRHMGFEMDPRELSTEESATLRRVTAWWKANRDWMLAGDILRLENDDPAVLGEMHLAADGARFAGFVAQMTDPASVLPPLLRLTGLEPEALYTIRLVNPEDRTGLSRRGVALLEGPVTLSGRALMDRGLALPVAFPATMTVLEGERV